MLCIFVLLVDFGFHYDGKTLVLITPVPEYCYLFCSQAFFAISLVYTFNKICIFGFMLRIFWSFHDVFSKVVPQPSNWQFNQRISYPLSDPIVLGLYTGVILKI